MTPKDLLERYEADINRHDFDAVAPLISETAVFWFNDGSFVGHAAIRAAFERTWRTIQNERYWLTDRVWVAEGETAATALYRFNWSGLIDGKACSGSGRGTTVLRLENSGWKIVHEHLSGEPDVQVRIIAGDS